MDTIFEAELMLARRRLESQRKSVEQSRSIHEALLKSKAPARAVGVAYAKLMRQSAAMSDTEAYITELIAANPQASIPEVKRK